MAGPDSALRRLTRDAGKLLQPYGFHGSQAMWVRVAPGGAASVCRTRTLRTWTGGHQELKFGLNLSATPTAWWEFCNWRNAQLGLPLMPLEQATGPGLINDHGMPDDLTELWSLQVDPTQPGRALQTDVDAIRAELPRRVHAYARRALRLLEPGRYLDELLTLPDPQIGTWEAIVVLLADRGPGPQLEDAFIQLRACFAGRDTSAYAENVIAYARGRAALARAGTGTNSRPAPTVGGLPSGRATHGYFTAANH
ncbi:hypothetical protein OHA40_31920 [Nocardia sp. NBC_00508]|uniref:hypothetical protein n=1 Tax=Nocardia sp. NBC_00508 TaxID=2975992 RepID=UPI002E80FF7A|nr:hypothetical protein [Nocardia sp. NBC_00508]WUD66123.1 hypothetical protein OHA40_31920 [Nocardia sp. NBC_00508]